MGFSWGDASHHDLIEDYLLRAIQQTRQHYHIHSERIYLAGKRVDLSCQRDHLTVCGVHLRRER